MIQRAIYRAYARTKHPGFGALGQVNTDVMYTKVSTPHGSYWSLRPEFRSLVVNAISNNFRERKSIYIDPSVKAFVREVGAVEAGIALQKMIEAGKWVYVIGEHGKDPLEAELIALAPMESEAEVAQRVDTLPSGFVLAEGADVGGPVDSIQRELKRAELGLRWGSIAGAVIGLGIIASIEAKRRLR